MLTTLFISGLVALPLSQAAVVVDRANANPGFVRFPVTKREYSWDSNLSVRQTEVDLANTQSGEQYMITLGVGTPPQNVQLLVDTGSSDLWVDPDCLTAADSTDEQFCETLGQYDYTKSSTFVNLNESRFLSYGTGNATIEDCTETITFGSAKLTAQRFGVAISSDNTKFGILGLGFRIGANEPDYSRFIDSLVTQGITKSRAFSLDLRSIDDPNGAVIFGGVDTGKYIGALQKVPIIPANESPQPGATRYWLKLDAISLTKADGSSTPVSTTSFAINLDSGAAADSLPAAVYAALGSSFPTAVLDPKSGRYVVDCAVAEQAGSIDFTFAGKTISVAYKDAILAFPEDGICILAAESIDPNETVPIASLGPGFLRAAYAVYDQDNHNVHLAQAANCGTNIIAIGSGVNAVPSKTGDCGGSSSSSTTSSSTTTTPPPSSTTSGSATITAPPSSKTASTAPPYHNSTSLPSNGTVTSTVYTTTVYTVTSCAKTVTNCPVGHLTTQTLTSLTTFCPGSGETSAVPPPPPPPSSVESTTLYPTETETATGENGPTGGGGPAPVTTVSKHCSTCEGGGAGPTKTSSGAAVVVTAGAEKVAGHAGLGLGLVAAVAVALL